MGALRKRRSADHHLPVPFPHLHPEDPPPWKKLKQPASPPAEDRAPGPLLPLSLADSPSPASFPTRYPSTCPPRHFHCPQPNVRAFGIGSADSRRSHLVPCSQSVENDAETRILGSRPAWVGKPAFFATRKVEKRGEGLGLVQSDELLSKMDKGHSMTTQVDAVSLPVAVSGVMPKSASFSTPQMKEMGVGLGLEQYKELVSRVDEGHLTTPHVEVLRSPLAVSDLTQKAEAGSNLVVMNDQGMNDELTVVSESLPARMSKVWTDKVPLYKSLLENSKKSDAKLRSLQFELSLEEKRIASFRRIQEISAVKPTQESDEPFIPLTKQEEDEVNHALSGGNRREVLTRHEASNIEITREVMQCLRYGAWLNDEVINLYLELLKERERREPKKYLKCHFFNTFFYKKLISGSNGYDFKSVKRWTTQKKIGYGLIECDKIFVPVHKEVHWCLAVINVRDKKFQYLDSLGGMDTIVLKVLARYFMDEVRDKSGKQVETLLWKQEGVHNLPLQENGWDCGMFMLKYADFYSRDLSLCFAQEHMHYFRMRTVKEILGLKAE